MSTCLLVDPCASAAPISGQIGPAHEALLMRSYRRCMSIGLNRGRAVDAAALLTGTLPFDVDALGLLKPEDIEQSPRESVGGTVYIRCAWFGAGAPQGIPGARPQVRP